VVDAEGIGERGDVRSGVDVAQPRRLAQRGPTLLVAVGDRVGVRLERRPTGGPGRGLAENGAQDRREHSGQQSERKQQQRRGASGQKAVPLEPDRPFSVLPQTRVGVLRYGRLLSG